MKFIQKCSRHLCKRNYSLQSKLRIPVINAENYQQDRASFCRDVFDAFSQVGFLYLKNSPLSTHKNGKKLDEESIRLSQWLFGLPDSQKQSVATRPENNRGYYHYKGVGFGEEATQREDDIEAYAIGNHRLPVSSLKEDYYKALNMERKYWLPSFIHQKNQWPVGNSKEYEDFANSMKEVYNSCQETSNMLLEALALACKLDREAFVKFHSKNDCTLELKHYKPLSGDTSYSKGGVIDEITKKHYQSNISISESEIDNDGSVVRVKSHADLSSLTLLLQNDVNGLEILARTNDTEKPLQWISAPYIPDTVLVNTGNCMEIWTNGRLKSTKHRVIQTKDNMTKSRYSVVYFCMPDWETTMNPMNSESHENRFGDMVPFI